MWLKMNRVKDEQKRQITLDCRDKAMKTWAKAKKNGAQDTESEEDSEKEQPVKKRKRRGSSDALTYLAERADMERELRKQEIALRREEMHLQLKLMTEISGN